ncbi:spore germination protein [Clostridium sp. YIM B02505]|uniref:Spore germination protein n=1 Tax=Clostridium yunnanense TaxID=2800325 RepID=A0ABS1EP48_9CLOT|nr:spore germination protein [Clostridium yunnanense]MBK1811156.1 spore germination protein [Clostridium yunnanense]
MDEDMKSSINLKYIEAALNECPDIIKKVVYIEGQYEGFFIYMKEIVNYDVTQRDFIKPITALKLKDLTEEKNINNIPSSIISFLHSTEEVLDSVMTGAAVFVCEKLPFAVASLSLAYEKRSIEEPITEKNVRGSHEGFVEALDVNISILRRGIKNNKLKFKQITLGRQTKQIAAVAYISGIANEGLVNNVYNKLQSIDIDGVPNVGYIEQTIIDFPNTIFPQFQSTERPDKAIPSLLEGRIIVMLNGTPRVIIAPVSFFSFFQAMDDYTFMWLSGSFSRLVRVIAFILALFLPSMYIAVVSFHYYAVPLSLLVSLAESRAKVPFPPIIEALILEFTVEMIREAAIRLPTYVGTAISVVAGLIIGQAAVEAGIVSNLLIIIVAVTAIASYTLPSQDMAVAVRILRFVYMIVTSIFGIIGIVMAFALTAAHLIRLESLGQPYFQPISPLDKEQLKDSIIRFPYKLMKKRPFITRSKNKFRGGNDNGKA